jgi:hypothetical protein
MRILSSNRDPLIQTAATQSLLRLERTAKNSKELHEFITRPLAIAIGMPFNGLPMCPKHREKIEHFIDTNFDGLLRHLGSAVKEELGVQKRFKTSAIMSAIRIRRT